MKTHIIAGLLAAACGACPAYADYIDSVSPDEAIPAGNPVGVAVYSTISGLPSGDAVSGLTVSLNVSGGYNGSLYAYLVAPNGTQVTLVDQPGATTGNPFGAAGSGLDVTLSNAGLSGIQTATEIPGAVLTGTFQAAESLSAIDGSTADGTWTLFIASLIADSGNPTLTNITLDVTVVPTSVPDGGSTLLLLGSGLLTMAAVKRWWLR